ncbi:heme lyase CcmF/NrfE family subunit [Candidatus Poribacteria bacterium]|nr:heme lyase CcmF/NrfE family subunit [Candidatus Poribacteria bacterium]
MIALATAATYVTLVTGLWSIIALGYGLRMRAPGWIRSGRRAVVATGLLVTWTTMALVYALASDMWHLQYVWANSLEQQPFGYKVGSLWGGMSGSMLFWLWIQAATAALVALFNKNIEEAVTNYALLILSIITLFFAVMSAGLIPGVDHPFKWLDASHIAAIEAGEAIRGKGLNPLLQTPAMLLHPPALYAGFVLLSVPFAYAVGALMAGAGSSTWIVRSRRWTISAWLMLSLGLLLGGAWAYHELGWGGYWGWDPVENAALLPWLTITAFLHSVMIQEHRNMLKVWNIVLITVTFLLVIFGTMLVRSGVLSSVHAFGQSKELLIYFVLFLLFVIVSVTVLTMRRWEDLRSPNAFDSLVSRESAFLLNNWIFVVCAVVVLAGTTFPVISEAYYQMTQGIERKIAVSEPFYNTFIVPIGLILMVMTGIGPLISWKKASGSNLKRNFSTPLWVGAVAMLICVYPFYMIGIQEPGGFPWARTIYALLCVWSSVFVLVTVIVEVQKGVRVRLNRGSTGWFSAMWDMTMRNKRRYGGYLIHVGIVLFYLGVLGSKGFQISHRQILAPGDTYEIGGYTLTYAGEPFQERTANSWLVGVPLEVRKGGNLVTTIKPARGHYDNNEDNPTYEAAILRRPGGDLYAALGEITEDKRADIQFFYNPLAWMVLWFSPLVMVAGGIIALAEKARGRETAEGATA